MARVIARIQETLEVELPLHRLFEAPTVAELSAEIERLLLAKLRAISEEEAERMLGTDMANRVGGVVITANERTETPTANSPAVLSLYHLLDQEVLANPYPLYRRLRTEDPVHWDPFLHAWVVTRYADVVKVLHDFSADRTPRPEQLNAMGLSALEPIAQVMVKQMLFMDAPAHTRLRALASSAFTPHRVEILRSHILEIANSLLDAVGNTGRMDVIADFAAPLPAIVTAEMLGVPVADHRQLKQWSADFAEMLGNFQHNPDHIPRVLQSLRALIAYFRDAIRQQRTQPREGLVHAFLNAEIEGDRLTEEEVIANCIVTMVGGQETTTNLIGNGMLSLLKESRGTRETSFRLFSHPVGGRRTAAL